MDNKLTVLFLNENQSIVMKNNMKDLPLKSEGIIKKSIELLNDSDPCVIHKSFIIKKIIIEIEEYLKQTAGSQTITMKREELPDNISELLDLDSNIRALMVGYNL